MVVLRVETLNGAQFLTENLGKIGKNPGLNFFIKLFSHPIAEDGKQPKPCHSTTH